MEVPLDGQRTTARPPAKLRFSLSPEQLDWLDRESRSRNVDKPTLLSEIFERGSASAAPPTERVLPPVMGGLLGVPRVMQDNGASAEATFAVSSAVETTSPPPVATPPPLAHSVDPPPAPAAVSGASTAEATSLTASAAQPSSPLPPSMPWSSASSSVVAASGLPRGAIVLVLGPDGSFAPTRVSPDLFELSARPTLVGSFLGTSWLVPCLLAVLLVLVLAGFGAQAAMNVLSSRYDFREVAVSPGRSMYYRVDPWTGDMVRCRTDIGPVGPVC